ncbi:MAG: dTDP-4-dehydrorhamnose 3,5-epimerase family protein [Egibacteraceae bacterium]
MRFHPTEVDGAWIVELERVSDDRGYNARAWCAEEFDRLDLTTDPAQLNVIANHRKGTVRGMHWQADPMADAKLFRVVRGALHDVVVDIRPDSPTRGAQLHVELRAGADRMLYVPGGCAQGFQTLTHDTELMYLVSAPYAPSHGRGFRYDDPAFGIAWPLDVSVVSDKDRSWPDWEDPT